MIRLAIAALAALLTLCGCAREPEPRRASAPAEPKPKPQTEPFDQHFWEHWGGGNTEQCTYELTSRGETGQAVTLVRVDDQRVMHFSIRRTYEQRSEMLTTNVALDALSGRPAGAVVASSYSRQDPGLQSWAQATYTSTRAFLQRRASDRPDLQQFFDYYSPGFSADGLMLWARRIAWPRVAEGRRVRADMLTSIAEDHRLESHSVMLRRTAETADLSSPAQSISFTVHPALPHPIKAWQSSSGERAKLIACETIQSKP